MVSIVVYDLLGKRVETLVNEIKSAGVYEIPFDSKNLSSGIYFYTMNFKKFIKTKSMMLLK
jgi:hypothetical protein